MATFGEYAAKRELLTRYCTAVVERDLKDWGWCDDALSGVARKLFEKVALFGDSVDLDRAQLCLSREAVQMWLEADGINEYTLLTLIEWSIVLAGDGEPKRTKFLTIYETHSSPPEHWGKPEKGWLHIISFRDGDAPIGRRVTFKMGPTND